MTLPDFARLVAEMRAAQRAVNVICVDSSAKVPEAAAAEEAVDTALAEILECKPSS